MAFDPFGTVGCLNCCRCLIVHPRNSVSPARKLGTILPSIGHLYAAFIPHSLFWSFVLYHFPPVSTGLYSFRLCISGLELTSDFLFHFYAFLLLIFVVWFTLFASKHFALNYFEFFNYHFWFYDLSPTLANRVRHTQTKELVCKLLINLFIFSLLFPTPRSNAFLHKSNKHTL